MADELGDRARAFRACRLAIDCLGAQGAATSVHQPEYLIWAERANRYAEPESIERAHAELALANAYAIRKPEEARRLQVEALAIARQHHDAEALFKSSFYLIFSAEPERCERRRLSQESIAWPRENVSARSLALVLWSTAAIQLAEGNRAQADELWREVELLAERTHVVTAVLFVHQRRAIEAILDGRPEEAIVLAQQFVQRAAELGAVLRGHQFWGADALSSGAAPWTCGYMAGVATQEEIFNT